MTETEELIDLPESSNVRDFDYVVHHGQIYDVQHDQFEGELYLVAVDEIPKEYHNRWGNE